MLSDCLAYWGRVLHICNRLTIIVWDNGLPFGRRQGIIWTNAGILLIQTSGTNFSEILSDIRTFLFKKMHLKMSSGKWRPFWLGLNVLIYTAVSSTDISFGTCISMKNACQNAWSTHHDTWLPLVEVIAWWLQAITWTNVFLANMWQIMIEACNLISTMV